MSTAASINGKILNFPHHDGNDLLLTQYWWPMCIKSEALSLD